MPVASVSDPSSSASSPSMFAGSYDVSESNPSHPGVGGRAGVQPMLSLDDVWLRASASTVVSSSDMGPACPTMVKRWCQLVSCSFLLIVVSCFPFCYEYSRILCPGLPHPKNTISFGLEIIFLYAPPLLYAGFKLVVCSLVVLACSCGELVWRACLARRYYRVRDV